jgi:GNAT superfamily N-acetyltransferase
MALPIVYRKGRLKDLLKLRMSEGLSATPESIEYNVLGMGHEFWIAVEEEDRIVGLTVLGRTNENSFKIMYLQVPLTRKGQGIGTGLIQAVLTQYPESEFSVIPFEGTVEFYQRLGFESATRWEMRRKAPDSRTG